MKTDHKPYTDPQLLVINTVNQYAEMPHRLGTKKRASLIKDIQTLFPAESEQATNLIEKLDETIINKSISSLCASSKTANEQECIPALRILANFCENESKKYLPASQQYAIEQTRAITPVALNVLKDNSEFSTLVYIEQTILSSYNKLFTSPIEHTFYNTCNAIEICHSDPTLISNNITIEQLQQWVTTIDTFSALPSNQNHHKLLQVKSLLDYIIRQHTFESSCCAIAKCYSNISSIHTAMRANPTPPTTAEYKKNLKNIQKSINKEQLEKWSTEISAYFSSSCNDYNPLEQTVLSQLHFITTQLQFAEKERAFLRKEKQGLIPNSPPSLVRHQNKRTSPSADKKRKTIAGVIKSTFS